MVSSNAKESPSHSTKFRISNLWAWFMPRLWWQKILVIISVILMLWVGGMYSVARWYIAKHANEPLRYGVTFIPSYAQYFGLDPKDTMQAMIDDLGVRHFRLVSYWDTIQPNGPDSYDFSDLDWQLEKIKSANATFSLTLGLRQPRWPECHMPAWAASQPKAQWEPQLKNFIATVVNRYKDNPQLDSYQLENEFFLKAFGKCPDFTRQRLIDEFNLVKSIDPVTPLVVTRSNNAVGIPINEPTPDMYGVAVYKRVWDKPITKRYFEYPLPAWFYASLAGLGEIVKGKDLIIHELQAEPWVPDGYSLNTAPISEQNKSMDAKRLKHRLGYAKATGMKKIDVWGAEWWYARKVQGDPSLWNVAKEEFTKELSQKQN